MGKVELPNVTQLRMRYEEFRETLFDNDKRIPPVKQVQILWSNKLKRTAGKCWYNKKTIHLATLYHSAYPKEIWDTLAHEMIHFIVPNHGPEFEAWMKKIREKGQSVHRMTLNRLPNQFLYIYTCQDCGHQFKYTKRLPNGGTRNYCVACRKAGKIGKLNETQVPVAH